MLITTFEVSFNDDGMALITFDRPRRLVAPDAAEARLLLARGLGTMRLVNVGEIVDFPPLSAAEYQGLLTARKVVVAEADTDGVTPDSLDYLVTVSEIV